MSGLCSEHNDLISKIDEIHSDLKVLVSEFKGMNGALKDTKLKADCHIDIESPKYRKKVDEIWAGIHFSKWIIGLILGSGLLFNFFLRK